MEAGQHYHLCWWKGAAEGSVSHDFNMGPRHTTTSFSPPSLTHASHPKHLIYWDFLPSFGCFQLIVNGILADCRVISLHDITFS